MYNLVIDDLFKIQHRKNSDFGIYLNSLISN